MAWDKASIPVAAVICGIEGDIIRRLNINKK
jgi:hypothetical protein